METMLFINKLQAPNNCLGVEIVKIAAVLLAVFWPT